LNRVAAVLALSIAWPAARGAAAEPAAPADPSSPGKAETRRVELFGFGAELGGSPALFGASLGFGSNLGSTDEVRGRWMAWLEADGTDWFRPGGRNAGRVDRVLWIYPHAELSRRLVRAWRLFGWIEAGPTVGRYTAGDPANTLWFAGVAAGAGVLLSPVRLGVTWYGQWKSATVPGASAFGSPDVRMSPMLFVTAGLELVAPLPR
jgi:hypothetical protein